MNFTNCVEDGTQLFKYSREMYYYHVHTVIFSMGNVTAMTEHQKVKSQPTQMQSNLIFWAHYHQDYFL
jgi:hypothetical protein